MALSLTPGRLDAADARVSYTPKPIPAETAKPIPDRIGIADVMPRLEDEDRPFNVVVLGDSTGVSENGWHVNLAVWMGETYDRPAIIHPWDGRPSVDAYQDTTWGMTQGVNAPIDMWNASVGSTKSDHPMTRLDRMIPVDGQDVDLIFVNYGHNHTTGNILTEGSALVKTLVERYPDAAVVLMLQNPERAGSPHASMQMAINSYWQRYAEGQGFDHIDVWSAFKAEPDLDALLDPVGDLHPNKAGYKLWSDTVIDALTSSNGAS
ncbi:SGNH/GDSL hydrolase family protein [Microbacterium oleivorans]|uniref:SGNH/GDSL hydrolase family protein n=1 Tax=Microbacterium oleivorans TaxID=273677 RepID=UPI0013DE893F|nr:SGNH/GDSL hydrolase family protein [Microbacterium oleivorans]